MKRKTTAIIALMILSAMMAAHISAAYAASNPFAWGWCTWYAWQRAYDKWGTDVPCRGNANVWHTQARNANWPVDSTAKSDSIAVWTSGQYGHVAYVEKVGDGRIYISEMNGNGGFGVISEGYFDISSRKWIGTKNDGTNYYRNFPDYYIHVTSIVSFNANGGSGAPGNLTKVAGIVPSIPTAKPTRTGYSFVKWNSSKDGNGQHSVNPGDQWGGDFDITFYAIWKANATYTVSYNKNTADEVQNMPTDQKKTHDQSLTLSSKKPLRSGHVFLGWATGSSATSVEYQSGGVYSSNRSVTLYAIWKPEEYAVTYDGNGSDVGNVPAPQSKVYGQTLTLSDQVPTRIGYTFRGWGTSADAASPIYNTGANYTENKPLKLYALWEITNPPKLSAADDIVMLSGDRRSWQDFVTLEHDGVLSYTLKASASANASIHGDTVKAGSAGSAVIEVSVVEYPAAKCKVDVQIIDLSHKVTLPADLTEIGSKAFANTRLTAVTIPNGCAAIAAKAFANNKSLVYVYIPDSVQSIASDAFSGSKNVIVYCNSGSAAEHYAQSYGIRCYTPSNDWVLASELPAAAKVSAEKWTYNLTTTETTTSTKTALDGYTQTGFTWRKTGSGTWTYANYPGGFDTGHALYKSYNKSALAYSETATTKREVRSSSRKSYIYWHWTFTDVVNEDNRNVLVEDARRTGVNIGGSVYRDFIYFDAFETAKSLSTEGMTTSGLKSFDGMYSTYHHPEYNKPEYASWWWWRFEVYNQSYTDYEKLFNYTRTIVTQKESDREVVEGNGVSDVQHWVKYSF